MGGGLLYLAIAAIAVFTHWQYMQGNIGRGAAMACGAFLFGTVLVLALA